MNTDLRKLMRILAILGGAYIATLSVVADLAQVLTLKYGVPLLILLLVAVIVYYIREAVRAHRTRGQLLQEQLDEAQDKLNEARDFLRGYGDNVLSCALTHWLFEQRVNSIRVSDADRFHAEGIVMLDISQVPLKPDDHLEKMHFAIIGRDKGERAKGRVKLHDSAKAHLELYEQTGVSCVGDLVVPIEPPEATDLERLLGNILFIVSE